MKCIFSLKIFEVNVENAKFGYTYIAGPSVNGIDDSFAQISG